MELKLTSYIVMSKYIIAAFIFPQHPSYDEREIQYTFVDLVDAYRSIREVDHVYSRSTKHGTQF